MTRTLQPAPAAAAAGKWAGVYKSKLITIDEAVSKIRSDQDVVVAQFASEPQGLMSRFHTAAAENVRVFSVLTLKPYDFYMRPDMKGRFEL